MRDEIKKTMEMLENNNMHTQYAKTAKDVLPLLEGLIPDGATVGVGGSVTLSECDVPALLRDGKYHFLDRNAPGITPEQAAQIMDKSLMADVFITSSNAVTMQGELYNVDGRGNRVAAICYGPKRVIIIAGANKIVPDVPAAIRRVKEVAAPKNAKRLGCATPCVRLEKCISLCDNTADDRMCAGCQTDARICASYVVSGRQRTRDRIFVILCGENLGY